MKQMRIPSSNPDKYKVFDESGKRVDSFIVLPEREISSDLYEKLVLIGVKSFKISGAIKTDSYQTLSFVDLIYDLNEDEVSVVFNDSFEPLIMTKVYGEYISCLSFDSIACKFQDKLTLHK